jgi:LAS superfamily LD-carboxypeptidase LdcB
MNKRFFLLYLLAELALAGVVIAQTAPSPPAQGQKRQDTASPAQPSKQRRDDGQQAAPTQPAPAQPAQDASKRPQRLTPEERKELRQQINEAGHDIYPRKRTAP